MRRALPYISIMAMHIFLDLVNVDPRAFIYPHYGWLKQVYTGGKPLFLNLDLGLYLKGYLPGEVLYKFPFGHYLIFEVFGAIVIMAVMIERLSRRRTVIALPETRELSTLNESVS